MSIVWQLQAALPARLFREFSVLRGVWCECRLSQTHHLLNAMNDEHDLIDSPLNRTYRGDGRAVEIHIYRMPHTG